MYLATVTCNRDFHQMLLQAESIQRFLHPCKHVIIINEAYPDIDFWYRWLRPYYTNHELLIIPKIYHEYPTNINGARDIHGDINENYKGWTSQQLQKMLLAYHFEDDYLLLDSKNFFIKETHISEWNNVIGSDSFQKFQEGDHFQSTYKKYVNVFGKELEYFLGPHTPFKINREILITKCSISELAYKLFYPKFYNNPISEGIFYSFLVGDEINKYRSMDSRRQRSVTIWETDNNPTAKMAEIILNPDIKVTGIHRNVLSTISANDLAVLEIALNSPTGIGFTNKIYPMPNFNI